MSVTAARGFRASGVAAGLKSSGGRDVALVVNDGPSHAAAGVFTRNRVQAAPVLWSRQVLAAGQVRAVVLNSGGANACTGPLGFQDTHTTAEHVADVLGCGAGDVAVCSTGLIGERLDLPALLGGVDAAAAALSVDGADDAANAIMTTDTVSKQATAHGNGFVVGGMAKGAGMLAPALATMLVVLTTDAEAGPDVLSSVLAEAVRTTFERLDSDGCMSTNDTVLLLASGASGREVPQEELLPAVRHVCGELAQRLLADAEGASKEIAVTVTNAASEDDAVEVARAVARSNLVKCAIHGEDPNWGRVLAAVGTTDVAFDPLDLGVAINGFWLARSCAPAEDRSKADLSARRVDVTVDLGAGGASATVWTNDLTADYVHENSTYSS